MDDWLRSASRTAGARRFLLDSSGASHTFDDVEAVTRREVAALRAAGVGSGARVGLVATNDLRSIARLFAIPRLGATVVLANHRLADPEIAWQFEQAEVGHAYPAVGTADPIPPVDGSDATMAADPDVDHTIVFTSGSTGPARPVRLTWSNLEAAAAASAEHLAHTSADRWLCVLPISHIGGMSIVLRSARQQSEILLQQSFDPAISAAALRAGGVTIASLVATMLRRILDVDPGPYRGVRAVLLGGGATPLPLLAEAIEAGLPMLPTYGMTETASQIATRAMKDALRPGLAAEPLSGAEIRVVDGVIEVRGPMVSPGYLGEPERRPEGWLRTSDLGRIEGGLLTVAGRADDVIITGGENVNPILVENVIREVDGVGDVCVVGVPHELWGQEIVAVVEGDVAPGTLERHARYRLGGFQIPKRWMIVEALPRLSIGKVDRIAVGRMAVESARIDGPA